MTAEAFSSKSFAQFLNERKIKHIMNAVASSWANGQVERVNRFLKSTLSKISVNIAYWKNVLGNVQFIINNTLHRSINTTPSKILLRYDQRQNFDNELREFIDHLAQIDVDIERERTELRDSAQIVNRAVHKSIIRYSMIKNIRNLHDIKKEILYLLRFYSRSPVLIKNCC